MNNAFDEQNKNFQENKNRLFNIILSGLSQAHHTFSLVVTPMFVATSESKYIGQKAWFPLPTLT